jgi:hypothetical protein
LDWASRRRHFSWLAGRGFVDYTQFDTLWILKTIEERIGLDPLSTPDARAVSLKNRLR